MKKDTLRLVSLVLAALAVIVFLLLPAVKAVGTDDTANGLTIIFGNSEDGWEFSILGLVAILLPIAAIVLLALNKGGFIVPAALSIVAAVLFFLTPSLLVVVQDFVQAMLDLANMSISDIVDLGIGAIIAGILALGSGAASLLQLKAE